MHVFWFSDAKSQPKLCDGADFHQGQSLPNFTWHEICHARHMKILPLVPTSRWSGSGDCVYWHLSTVLFSPCLLWQMRKTSSKLNNQHVRTRSHILASTFQQCIRGCYRAQQDVIETVHPQMWVRQGLPASDASEKVKFKLIDYTIVIWKEWRIWKHSRDQASLSQCIAWKIFCFVSVSALCIADCQELRVVRY